MLLNKVFPEGIDFEAYLAYTRSVLKSPNPQKPYDNPKILKYTEENLKRMEELMQNIALDKKLYHLLSANPRKLKWIVLTEPWCGDAAQIVPLLAAMANTSDNIFFTILLSDSHPDILDNYLTNGSRSIPKLICIDEQTNEELGTWGPRPQRLQQLVIENKNRTDIPFSEKVKMVHEWYNQNKTRDIQKEFIDLMMRWTKPDLLQ
ncbi:MAG: thioredoxin family protein [Chitinophagales bacterium]|nr:thioredoxin family protein [Chitinophagales bacterium]MDW8273225.1 thioredoxin family protein [Chitinophagales bacterium]